MIYLRTGGNGSCKTLFTLFDVRQMQIDEKRPVYFVKDRFTPKPILTDDFGWTAIDFKDWESCEDGAIILCDEVHYDLPLRSQSAAPPEHIGRLSEHRKRGFDFFMLTQHPMNIDAFVRRLVQAPGWHEHLKVILGGTKATKILHWDAVNSQCEKDGSGKSAQITTRTQPKEVYDWYESASLHTAKVRIPKAFFTLIGAVVALIVIGYMLVQHFSAKAVSPAEAKKPDAVFSSTAAAGNGSLGNDRKPMSAAEYVSAYQPRISGLMHTAPAYDRLTEPRRVPVPAACVEMSSKGCKCYTQDATPYPVEQALCRQLVQHGTFLAFLPEGEQQRQQRQAPAAAMDARQGTQPDVQQPSGLVLIGDSGNASGAATGLAGAPPVEQGAQPRVRPGSQWSFQSGG